MAKPDFSNFGNVIIMSARGIGKDHFFEEWMNANNYELPKEWKLLRLRNYPLIYDSKVGAPKYPPIPHNSFRINDIDT